ncbi:MAG: hypothetical protein ACON41_07555 [Parvibaculales bacterium]
MKVIIDTTYSCDLVPYAPAQKLVLASAPQVGTDGCLSDLYMLLLISP